ncbi:hypothetical protein [Paludibacterium paludis]|uniref:Uncharacterized protein n=1 Tax=Paludibacterium paludis TaxID=1225769 RepID=A0A918UBQ6_9NEIS|nr:hypothetical protein [Paludibacterium paludis]GGY26047.1 hypothetical protein GCM10011289_32070 [Paludibacterium paludis]
MVKKALLFWAAWLCASPALADAPQGLGPSCPDLSIAGIESRDDVLRFIARLKTAAEARDARALIGLTHFPVRVSGRPMGRSQAMRSAKHVFTDKVYRAILGQDPAQLFCNYQGVMIGNGQIWFSAFNGRPAIIAINR